MKALGDVFETNVEVPRIKVGKRQNIDTLINEETHLFGKYLRNEYMIWLPRVVILN